MPDICDELRTWMKTKTAITDIVGTSTAAKIYQHDAKQGVAPPYIVLHVFEGSSSETLSAIAGVAMNRVQVDCYGLTNSAAYALAEAVRVNLQMYRGTMGSTAVLNVTSNGGYERLFDPPSTGANQKRYIYSRDYLITYREATS
jgi:hypothetical protein